MTASNSNGKPSAKGCLKALGGFLMLLLSLAAYVGGLILAAWALHGILNGTDDLSLRVAACVAGILMPWIVVRQFRRSRPDPLKVTWGDAFAGVGSLLVGGSYLFTWAKPSIMGEGSVEIMATMLALEFILIHSAPFLALTLEAPGTLRKRVLTTLGLSAMYAIFPVAMGASIHSWTPFAVFGAMVISKFLVYFFHRLEPTDRATREERWGIAAMCYLGCAVLSVFIPMPKLGVYSLSGNGIWQEMPERALGVAAVYFTLLGFYEIYFQRRTDNRKSTVDSGEKTKKDQPQMNTDRHA
jgi:hypothetical protein